MTYDTDKLRTRAERRLLDFDPDSGSATYVTLNPAGSKKGLPINQFRRYLFGVFHSVGAGAITLARIIAATADDGTGAVAVVTKALTAQDAVGDYAWLECDVEQIHEALATATFVLLELTLATSTDECVVLAERSEPMFPTAGLTADYNS
jgi:hypothetical protein